MGINVFPTTGDANYTHEQGLPASTWIITHNLGKYPTPTVIDSAGSQVEGEPEYVDKNNMKIHFNVSFSGTATLN